MLSIAMKVFFRFLVLNVCPLFLQDRLREINIRDLRNLSVPQKNLTLDMSSG